MHVVRARQKSYPLSAAAGQHSFGRAAARSSITRIKVCSLNILLHTFSRDRELKELHNEQPAIRPPSSSYSESSASPHFMPPCHPPLNPPVGRFPALRFLKLFSNYMSTTLITWPWISTTITSSTGSGAKGTARHSTPSTRGPAIDLPSHSTAGQSTYELHLLLGLLSAGLAP